MTTTDALPRDYLAQAKALRAKFYPATAPVVTPREQPRIVEITRPTYESIRKTRAVVFAGRVYGPHPIARDMWHLSSDHFERGLAAIRSGPSARRIVVEVAERHGLAVEDILGPRRSAALIAARHEAMAEVYTRCPALTLPQMGVLFKRDHTTVLSALKKLKVWRGATS
jgi:hypothetical protein